VLHIDKMVLSELTQSRIFKPEDVGTSIDKSNNLGNDGRRIQSHIGTGIEDCMFTILPIKVRLKNSCVSVNTYAFLDSGSNVSFCLMIKLGATGKKRNITIDT